MIEDIYRFSEVGPAKHLRILQPEPGVIYERNLPFNVQAAGVSYCDDSYSIERKKSNITCIEYIVSGRGNVTQDQISFNAMKGDVYILHRGHNHRYYSEADEPMEKIWFNVYGEFVDNALISYGLKNRVLIKDCNIEELMKLFIEKVSQDGQQSDIFDDCSVVFLKIMQKLFKRISTQTLDTLAEKFLNLINECDDYSKGISEIIAPLACSKEHAIREFTKTYGISPYKYITSCKMSAAKKMVETTDLQISEIAYKLNFSDAHYFSYFFKDYFNISPSDMRKKIR